MKICFVGSGEIPIPPQGWGGLESVVWNLYLELQKLGLKIYLVNEKDTNETLNKVIEINPDIVHLHYGKHWEIMPQLDCRKIVTSYDGSFKSSKKFHDYITRKFFRDCEFFCLNEDERFFFVNNIGISNKKVKILPTGVQTNLFKKKTENLKKPERTICIGKIDYRKRQHLLQYKDLNIDFVGPNAITEFDSNDSCYLGIWSEEQKYNDLTEYGNFILLSSSENGGPPLVCLEALSAGLGLVVSEPCAVGLDINKKFISVIPENRVTDYDFINSVIKENRKISLSMRQEIFDYVKDRDWSNIANIYKGYI